MNLHGHAALVTGAASGLGAAAARELARRGARVAVLDVNLAQAEQVAAEIGGLALRCDVADSASVTAALDAAQAVHGAARIVVNAAGIVAAQRVLQKDGTPAPLDDFERVLRVNLVGSYNVIRLAAARTAALPALDDDGERGVIINTASIAAWDGQVGQAAYAASKGAIASMTLPLARDLAQFGIRVVGIAPGIFMTPMMAGLPAAVQESLAASIPFPKRMGRPSEFGQLVAHIVENIALNGEVIRLDGALRMAPR